MTPGRDVPDYGTIDLGDVVLSEPLVVANRTGVTVRAGNVYWQGPPDRPAVELVSSTQCRVEFQALRNVGTPRTGIGIGITPVDGSPISAVKNQIRVGVIQSFGVGIQIGNGTAKACDETSIADGTIAGCRDAIAINGGNAQLQYLDRMRLVWCENAGVNVARGGVHLTNSTLGYSRYGVLIGHANPYVVLRDVFTEGVPLGVATTFNSNAPGTLQISGGWFEGIRWHHNAPVTISGVDLYSPMEVEEGVVFGRGINLTNPNRKPADHFLARGKASYDVAGSQQQADGTWRAWEYKGTGVKP